MRQTNNISENVWAYHMKNYGQTVQSTVTIYTIEILPIALLVPVLMYDNEVWILKQADRRQRQSAAMRFLKAVREYREQTVSGIFFDSN